MAESKKILAVTAIHRAFGHDYPFKHNGEFINRKARIAERNKVAKLAAKFLKISEDDIDFS